MKIIDIIAGSCVAVGLAGVAIISEANSLAPCATPHAPVTMFAPPVAVQSTASRRIVDPQYGSIQIRFQWFMDIHCHELELNTKSRAKSRRALEGCWAKFTGV